MWPLGFPGSIFPRSPRSRRPVVIWLPTSNSGVHHSRLKPLGHPTSRLPARFRQVTKDSSCRIGSLMNSAPDLHTEGRRPIEIRQASEADNDELIALTRMTPMDGAISLRIDREPDFFALLRLRGKSKVYVAVQGSQVIGCISAALRTAYISGVPEPIAYIGDMKVHPSFSGSLVAVRLIKALEADLRFNGIDLCFCVAADGNHRVMPLFEGRLGMPRWVRLGRFLVNGLIPSPFTSH